MAKKKVNVKFLIGLTAVVGGLALALFAGGVWYLARTSSAGFQHRAKVAEEQGRYPEAANFLANAAGKDPNNRELFMRAGEMYERCVSIDPVYLGRADAQYRRVLEIDPTYQPAVQKLMDEMVARLHDGAAGTDFYTALKKLSEQAVSSDRNNPRYQIYTRVASLLQWMFAASFSRPDAATEKQIQELAKLAEDNPDIADGAFYLSQAQMAIARNLRSDGDTDGFHKLLDAIQGRYKAAVAARPQNPEVHWRAVLVYSVLHDSDDRADHQDEDVKLLKAALETAMATVKPTDHVYGDVPEIALSEAEYLAPPVAGVSVCGGTAIGP